MTSARDLIEVGQKLRPIEYRRFGEGGYTLGSTTRCGKSIESQNPPVYRIPSVRTKFQGVESSACAPVLSTAGGLNWLPPTFEYPVWHTRGVFTLSDGAHAVPLVNPSRIQIYDRDWNFIRARAVESGGLEIGDSPNRSLTATLGK